MGQAALPLHKCSNTYLTAKSSCEYPTGSPRRIVFTSKGKFRQISASFPRTFFDIISMVKKSTLFPRTFFDVISLVEKYTLFPRTFLEVISLAEISTIFSRTFFDVILIVKESTLFPITFFDVILMVKKFRLFTRTFSDEISTGKNSTSFLVKLQTNENIRRSFSFLATFENWLLQDCIPQTFQVNLPGVAQFD